MNRWIVVVGKLLPLQLLLLHGSKSFVLDASSLRRTTRSGFQYHHHHHHHNLNGVSFTSRRSRIHKVGGDGFGDDCNFLVTDSLGLTDDERPLLVETLSTPRNALALSVIAVGLAVSWLGVTGMYDGLWYPRLTLVSIGLGLVSSVASLVEARSLNLLPSSVPRRGIVDDATVTLFAGGYTAAVCWQALRTSLVCPVGLTALDGFLSWAVTVVYVYSLVAPCATLLPTPRASAWITSWRTANAETEVKTEAPALSDTERLRARGLVGIGVLGCLFAPEAVSFGLGGQEWWSRVSSLHPSQCTLESSTALFALYATEASMVAHRCGKSGVAPFKVIVPVFFGVCVFLTILPCVAALYWLGDDISFFSFYVE